MTAHRILKILRNAPPYFPGDVAGFDPVTAQFLVDRKVAQFADKQPDAPISFDAMNREELVRHAAAVLGFDGEPPEDTTDDEIREALKAHVAGMEVPRPPSEVLDQLAALDRAHLEAFATSKANFGAIDPDWSDDELREKIRAVAAGTEVAPAAPKKPAKAR